jgi:hypothetical protein
MGREPTAEHRCRAERRLAAICRRQLGVFSVQQAVACGVTSGTVYRRRAQGRYELRRPGVMAVAGAPDTREARLVAAMLLCGGDAVLARTTAADLHGLEHGCAADGIHVLVRSRTFVPQPELTVHRSSKLTAADVVGGPGTLRMTSVAWTLLDLAGLVDAERLRRLVSAGVRAGGTNADGLRALLDRRRRFPGRAAMRRILDELSPLEPVSRSELESLFLRVTTAAGLPPTEMNLEVLDAWDGRRAIDAVYLPERLPIELDSREHHGTLLDWNDDLRRENALALVGWRTPLRFTYADLRDRPLEVVEVVRAALDQARAVSAPSPS